MMNNFRVFLAMSLCCLPVVGAEEKKGEGYRFRPGDVISVMMDENVMNIAIDPTGSASFVLIGKHGIQGLTAAEVEEKIRAIYKKKFNVNPRLKVAIRGYAKRWYRVSGAVLNPGQFIFPKDDKMSLSLATARAGGLLPKGDSKNIIVVKHKDQSHKKYALATSEKIMIESGDIVVVPLLPPKPGEAKNVPTATVTGKVNNPGPIQLPKGGKIDVLTAIALAGGFNRIANTKTVIIKRKTKDGFKTSAFDIRDMRDGRVKMAFLTEGDILIIKEVLGF